MAAGDDFRQRDALSSAKRPFGISVPVGERANPWERQVWDGGMHYPTMFALLLNLLATLRSADALVLVKPDIVVRWHRAGFRLFW